MTHALLNTELTEIRKVGSRPIWKVNGKPAPDYVYRAGGVKLGPDDLPLKNPDGTYKTVEGEDRYFPVHHDRPPHDPYLQRTVLNPQSEWLIESERVVATYDVVDIPLNEAIETARQAAHDRINSEYEARTQVLAEGYPAAEQQSWPVQIREAEIVLGADDEPTPWIDAAAPARGITREALANLIKAQDTAYRQYHGALTGTRQALRDQIAAAPDDDPESVDALYAIAWPETETETETT